MASPSRCPSGRRTARRRRATPRGTGTVAAASGTDAAGTTATDDGADHDTRFFGQPWALAHIFGVEMWERFSFYGMQGILLIYMYYSVAEGGLGIDRRPPPPASSARTAAPSTCRRSSARGSPTACSARSGCCSSAPSSSWPVTSRSRCCPSVWGLGVGLILVAVGSGGLKANATAVVGTLYSREGHRAATRASRCSTSASTSARSSARSSPASCRATSGSTGASAPPRSAWRSASSSTRSAASSCPRRRASWRTRCPPTAAALMIGIARRRTRCSSSCSCCSGVIRADNLAGVVILVTLVATIAYFAVIISSRPSPPTSARVSSASSRCSS